LSWSAIVGLAVIGAPQIAEMIMVTIGTAIALWCVLMFMFIGKGTPAPFDPPRKLVIRGPYRFVRNPIYIGAGMTLAGVTRRHFVSAWRASDELRRAVNKGTLRAFRYADRFPTFEIFRRPGALR
jgi:protein-S-isoprenylcysteine O-methyltransferase Ste14